MRELPTWELLAKKMIWQQLGKIENKRILDFGSGEGITASYYAKNNEVIAVEPSKEAVENRDRENEYVQLLGSVEKLKKMEDKSFDIILCHNVLEYAEDREMVKIESRVADIKEYQDIAFFHHLILEKK